MRSQRKKLFVLIFTFFTVAGSTLEGQVRIWEDKLFLPTYEPKPADKNPMFYVPDAYQGAKRVLYPYPLMDNLSTEKSDREHKALYLENEYIKLCLLPDIGGRLFYATDKTNNYEIFYRQHVIKPANIGMLGAWISGGIEWCVFHHHRASTHLPVDYRLVENEDGSKTIWFGEIEPRHRMKWSIGLTLHPGKSYIETDVRMYNRTEHTHSILYWANVATHVNDDYQVIFPPSVHQGVYHAKNSFIHWPVSDEIYNEKDYTGQIRVDWWKNHPDPISIFAHDLKEDFMGGYDHAADAGTVHVGNHHIVKGAKLWEWGPGEYGSMWDTEILTESDGPYAELMVGGYSDNQPDYSWINPGEMKHLKQYWYPVRNLGGFKKANLEAAVNVEEMVNNRLRIGFNATSIQEDCRLVVYKDEVNIYQTGLDLSPAQPYQTEIKLEEDTKLTQIKVVLLNSKQEELISYQEKEREYVAELPETVSPPRPPEDIRQIEELVLRGQRIMQFHNPGLDPKDYFLEALKRDPLNSLANLHMGNLSSQAGMYDKACSYYRKSIRRITADYTRPRDCEALYRLGVVLRKQGKLEDAIDTLYRASWDQAFFAPAHFELAGISMQQGNLEEALDLLNRSLSMNTLQPEAFALKSAVLRHLGDKEHAGVTAIKARMLDPLDHMAAFELFKEGSVSHTEFKTLLNDNKENYLELATDYLNQGCYKDALEVVEIALNSDREVLSSYPILSYYAGWLYDKMGDQTRSMSNFKTGAAGSTDYVFPFRFETLEILKSAILNNPKDGKAWYYMGNILYDHQPEKAMACWEQAVEVGENLAIAYRNLGWGSYRYKEDIAEAIKHYEQALALDQDDPRYFLECDRLYELNNEDLAKRLELFSSREDVVSNRNDSYLRYVDLLLLNGDPEKALSLLSERTFLRQEGVAHLHDLYVDARLIKGKELLQSGQNELALEQFLLADSYPSNHMIGRLSEYKKEAQIYYYTAQAHEAMKNRKQARLYLSKVCDLDLDGSEYLYYQSLAQRELGQTKEAEKSMHQLLRNGQTALDNAGETDFFAKFGERRNLDERKALAYFQMALAYLASNQKELAQEYLEKSIQLKNSNLWAQAYAKKK